MGLDTVCSLLVAFMCGRTACTLAPDDIVRACSYRDGKGKRRRPVWKDPPGGQQYQTSYNMAPGAFSPVLVSSKHFKEMAVESEEVDHVLMPMKWGLVPRWHKESPSKVSFKTSNCRGESMLEKATFRNPLQQGRRCVAVMDGFYEWKTTPSGKQPHYFHFSPHIPNDESKTPCRDLHSNFKTEEVAFKIENIAKESIATDENGRPLSVEGVDETTKEKKEIKTEGWTDSNRDISTPYENAHNDNDGVSKSAIKQEGLKVEEGVNDSKESGSTTDALDDESWRGHRLLTCAAVYDVWQPSNSPPLYSYSIITVAASKDMSWCHHRMPAVLSTDQEVCDWLDFSTTPLMKANKLIYGKVDCLTSHPVSKNVNNSRYQSPDCLKPIDPQNSQDEDKKKKLSQSGQLMMNWLKKAPSSTSTPTEAPPSKVAKKI